MPNDTILRFHTKFFVSRPANLLVPLFLLLISPLQAAAASASVTTQLSFGVILADPGGDMFEIDSSASFRAHPIKISTGWSYVMGGGNGIVTIKVEPADIAAGLTIQLTPPGSIFLQSGAKKILLDNINTYSMLLLTPATTGEYNFGIGGILHLGLNQQADDYAGTLAIQVDYL